MNRSKIFSIVIIFMLTVFCGSVVGAFPDMEGLGDEVVPPEFGQSVAGDCDLDGDGKPDLIVGAPWYGGPAGSKAGRVYIFSGADGSVICILDGEAAGDKFGWAVSCAGDVDGDDTKDIIVGAPFADVDGDSDAGKAYVFSGETFSLIHTFEGAVEYEQLGRSVSWAGDMNDDGKDDVIIGSPGVNTGRGKAVVYNSDTWLGDCTIQGDRDHDSLGLSVAGIGDMKNNGKEYVVAGAPYWDGEFGLVTNKGRTKVYCATTCTQICTPGGDSENELFGYSVAGAGYVNHDNYADIIVGAPGWSDSTGRVRVISGFTCLRLVGGEFEGDAAGDLFGWSVAGGGHISEDVRSDLLVGARGANDYKGRAYAYLGSTWTRYCVLDGEASGDELGFSVSGAGDVEAGDGKDDMIVGARYAVCTSPFITRGAGKAYVHSGIDCSDIFELEPVYHRVISPNGGELYCAHYFFCVTWIWCSGPESVRIDLSTDSGTSWDYVLTESTPNDGEFCLDWPCIPSENCRLKISDASTGDPYDESQSDFTSYRPGDANGDCLPCGGDIVYLISYLYRGGPPPYPMISGDPNCDGAVDGSDVVHLISYCYGGGDPPLCCEENPFLSAFGLQHSSSEGTKPATITFGPVRPSKDDVLEMPLKGEAEVPIALLEFHIEYNPEEVTMLEPALTSRTQGLQVFSSAKDGIQKIGIVDLEGQNVVSPGEGTYVLIRVRAKDLSSVHIRRTVLVGEDSYKIPVEVVNETSRPQKVLKPEESTIPEDFSLAENHPNPFNPQTEISYDLPKAGQVKLSIYNLLGQRIKTLVDEYQAAGHKRVCWDGTDDKGNKVASGIYFYRIKAGDFIDSRKMILMK